MGLRCKRKEVNKKLTPKQQALQTVKKYEKQQSKQHNIGSKNK